MVACVAISGEALPKRGCRPELRWFALLAALVLVYPMKLGAEGGDDDSVSSQYQLEANFLAMAPNFVEWPGDASTRANTDFRICVFGAYPFGTVLAEQTRAETVHGKRVVVKWVHQLEILKGCQIVFVSRSQQKRYGKALEALQGESALTVGETQSFVEAGGMVSLDSSAAGLQIDVNLAAAERAHLKISSRLLVLAHRVIGRGEGSKG
jgi:YfiR/HmsC-like